MVEPLSMESLPSLSPIIAYDCRNSTTLTPAPPPGRAYENNGIRINQGRSPSPPHP